MTTLRIPADQIQAGDTSHIAGSRFIITHSAVSGFSRVITVVGAGGRAANLYLDPSTVVTVERKASA